MITGAARKLLATCAIVTHSPDGVATDSRRMRAGNHMSSMFRWGLWLGSGVSVERVSQRCTQALMPRCLKTRESEQTPYLNHCSRHPSSGRTHRAQINDAVSTPRRLL